MDFWLQNYEGFDNAKNNIKQRNLNTVFANISKTTSPTFDHVTYTYYNFCIEGMILCTCLDSESEDVEFRVKWCNLKPFFAVIYTNQHESVMMISESKFKKKCLESEAISINLMMIWESHSS